MQHNEINNTITTTTTTTNTTRLNDVPTHQQQHGDVPQQQPQNAHTMTMMSPQQPLHHRQQPHHPFLVDFSSSSDDDEDDADNADPSNRRIFLPSAGSLLFGADDDEEDDDDYNDDHHYDHDINFDDDDWNRMMNRDEDAPLPEGLRFVESDDSGEESTAFSVTNKAEEDDDHDNNNTYKGTKQQRLTASYSHHEDAIHHHHHHSHTGNTACINQQVKSTTTDTATAAQAQESCPFRNTNNSSNYHDADISLQQQQSQQQHISNLLRNHDDKNDDDDDFDSPLRAASPYCPPTTLVSASGVPPLSQSDSGRGQHPTTLPLEAQASPSLLSFTDVDDANVSTPLEEKEANNTSTDNTATDWERSLASTPATLCCKNDIPTAAQSVTGYYDAFGQFFPMDDEFGGMNEAPLPLLEDPFDQEEADDFFGTGVDDEFTDIRRLAPPVHPLPAPYIPALQTNGTQQEPQTYEGYQLAYYNNAHLPPAVQELRARYECFACFPVVRATDGRLTCNVTSLTGATMHLEEAVMTPSIEPPQPLTAQQQQAAANVSGWLLIPLTFAPGAQPAQQGRV